MCLLSVWEQSVSVKCQLDVPIGARWWVEGSDPPCCGDCTMLQGSELGATLCCVHAAFPSVLHLSPLLRRGGYFAFMI